jgi:hypothetical protein
MVNKAVNEYWIDHIKKMSTYFKSLDYLNASNYSSKRLDLLYLLGLKVSALVFFDKIFPKFEAQF